MGLEAVSIVYPGLLFGRDVSWPFNRIEYPPSARFNNFDEAMDQVQKLAEAYLDQMRGKFLPASATIELRSFDQAISTDLASAKTPARATFAKEYKRGGSVILVFVVLIAGQECMTFQTCLRDDDPPPPDPKLLRILEALDADAIGADGRIIRGSKPRQRGRRQAGDLPEVTPRESGSIPPSSRR